MKSLIAQCMGLLGAAAMLVSATAPDRSVLPVAEEEYTGEIADSVLESTPDLRGPIEAPEGAPNVFIFMSDDVGFAMASVFGGPVETPNFERLAAMGQRYNRFHTTAICSPSRAALLTGRNHHNAGVGYLSDLPAGYPGYGGSILPSTATVAAILRLNGWNTAMFGKHHNTPTEQRTEAGPFDAWPTGLGFEYFFGFVSGDSDQYQPNLYRGIQRARHDEAPGVLLEHRMAQDMIRYIHNQDAGNPDKPWLIYYAPGSTHAPHQVPPEYIARFRGAFDHGWDEERERIFARQLAMGVVPEGTILTERPEEIPAWASLDTMQQAYSSRMMEVAAAQLVYQDEQLGLVLDEIERMGEMDNTLFAIISGDNGASAEAGTHGTLNEMRTMGVHDESDEWLFANIDNMGGPLTYQNYPAGWTWAMNTPLRWTKQYASMLGGIRNGMILAWDGHVAEPGAICSEFGHVIDIVPTVLDASGLPAPQSVLGTAQKPMDGMSLLPSLQQCQPTRERTQYFEIGGKVGLWHNGWFLSGDDGRVAWENVPPEGPRPTMQWSLYDLSRDFSQATDLAAEEPERLAAMQALWREEAERNNVFPLDHLFAIARGRTLRRPSTRTEFEFWGDDVSLPANSDPILIARSFTLEAQLELDSATASGVVIAIGSRFGGWSLYLDEGRPAFTWARSTNPEEIVNARAQQALPQGASELVMRFETTRPGAPADVVVSAGGTEFLRAHVPLNFVTFAGGGETLDIGRDLGVPVTDYPTGHGVIEGDIPHVRVTFDGGASGAAVLR